MKQILKVICNTIKFIVKTLLLLFAAFLIWWLVIIPITNNVILNGYVKELEETDMFTTGSWEGTWVIKADNDKRLSGLLDEYNRYRTEEMLAALEAPENLEGYYILYSLHSAAWDSFLTWDLRAH